MALQGFQTYNTFKHGIRELKQIYDITAHLYIEEHKRLELILPAQKTFTFSTQIGVTNHTVNSLYQLVQNTYPNKLRQLILISSITTLEVFLTDLVREIFQRDKTPFEEQIPIDFFKNQILNTPSIKDLHENMINKDVRGLTSGGLQEIKKYYNKKFKIDFSKIVANFKEIEEIHTRRHLHVHRNGICDKEYATKYLSFGFAVGERINIEHDYLNTALQKISDFASSVCKAVLAKYPNYSTGYISFHQTLKIHSSKQRLLLEIKLIQKSFDIEAYLKTVTVQSHKLIHYIQQISTKERNSILILYGESPILTRFFKKLKSHEAFNIELILELKT